MAPYVTRAGTWSGYDMVDMATLLNKTFNAVFTREDAEVVPDPTMRPVAAELRTAGFTMRKIKGKIIQLRTNTAEGPDAIGPTVCKNLWMGLLLHRP